MGCGQVTMSNIFLSTALITLAQKEIGCDNEDIECGQIYGYKPSSLITIIGTVSGILAALLLPFVGAIIDCTPHRRAVGVSSCVLLMSVQAIQIATTEKTWFAMSVLQAVNGFIYQVVLLSGIAYIPEIGRIVGVDTMNEYSSQWSMAMFGMQVCYLLTVIGFTSSLGLDDVAVGQLGQTVNVPASGLCYFLAWKFFTSKEASRRLPPGEKVIWSGFKQVFRTAIAIKRNHGASLGYFLIAVIFAESAANAFVLVAVTYLKEALKFNGTDIGILFFVVVLSLIPGSHFGQWVTKRSCPKTSMMLQLVIFIIVNFCGFLSLTSPQQAYLAYFFGVLWGFMLGWLYPTESLIFSMILPPGQDAELAGFYLYCSQILSWLPPFIFTLMNEHGVPLKWGGIHLNLYLGCALICYHLMLPWNDCIAHVDWTEMGGNDRIISSNDLKPLGIDSSTYII